MVVNPMAFFTPEQQRMLQEVQKFTQFIKATIHRDGDNTIVILSTDNPQAQPYLPQIQQALISSVAQSLYTMFNITGKVI